MRFACMRTQKKKEVVLWCRRNAPFRPFRAPICRVGRIQDCKDEKERFACMRTPKTKSGAVVQTKRSFSSPPNPHLDRAGSSGAPGGRGLVTVHGPAPSPSVSLRLCLKSISTHLLSHAGPGGRRTSPACGSCRRPRKSVAQTKTMTQKDDTSAARGMKRKTRDDGHKKTPSGNPEGG